MLLCNNDHYFWAFNAFLSVSCLYDCFTSISVFMSVSLLCFNFPLKYERDLSNLWWRVFLLEKARNCNFFVIQTLCQKHVFLSENKNKLCVKKEKNLDSFENYWDAFVKGSKNYKRSAVSDHEKILQHEKSKDLEEKEKCETSGSPYRKMCIR